MFFVSKGQAMSKQQTAAAPLRATIKKIVGRSGDSESYAVAYPTEDHGELKRSNSVTFSLSQWQGGEQGLRHGQVVELHEVTLFQHGWRASRARPVVPSNKQ